MEPNSVGGSAGMYVFCGTVGARVAAGSVRAAAGTGVRATLAGALLDSTASVGIGVCATTAGVLPGCPVGVTPTSTSGARVIAGEGVLTAKGAIVATVGSGVLTVVGTTGV